MVLCDNKKEVNSIINNAPLRYSLTLKKPRLLDSAIFSRVVRNFRGYCIVNISTRFACQAVQKNDLHHFPRKLYTR